MKSNNLLQDLQSAKWNIVVNTIGSSHATLIGVLVDWWISMDLGSHYALDGGPSNGYSGTGIRGQCDALFCEREQSAGVLEPTGVLEVEGSKPQYTAKKIGLYFSAKYTELKSLCFGILILYAYEPNGRGDKRCYSDVETENKATFLEVEQITSKNNNKDKDIVLITIDKNYVRQNNGIRARTEYYFGEPSKIKGHLYRSGRRIDSKVLYASAG
jgi:hypothetical protein